MKESPFYSYEEMSLILCKKFDATLDEINWWVRNSEIENPFFRTKHPDKEESEDLLFHLCLIAYSAEFPNAEGWYFCSHAAPEYGFYAIVAVENFIPSPQNRLVTIGDLSCKRNWTIYARTETNLYSQFPSLDIAAREGLIRFYDGEQFTFEKTFTSGNLSTEQLWYKTDEGQEMLSQPTTFFLLEDIIKIERLFLNRPYDECAKELGLYKEPSNDL